ncbi:MAG: futalosine hydrolase [Fibrobacteria bacterium]
MILICAATSRELDSFLRPMGIHSDDIHGPGDGTIRTRSQGTRRFAATGVGIPMTLARLLPMAAALKPELIVNVGIAGAYPGSGLGIGDLVIGESECFGDLGMETPDDKGFLPLDTFPWADDEYRQPLTLTVEPWRAARSPMLRLAKGCTVNQCAGREETGSRRRKIFGAGFETMEGAAAALAGRELGIPVCQLRAISNMAATRDMRPENVALALDNLGAYMGRWLGAIP